MLTAFVQLEAEVGCVDSRRDGSYSGNSFLKSSFVIIWDVHVISDCGSDVAFDEVAVLFLKCFIPTSKATREN